MQHAHQKGVIHRDIKPSNVLVAIQDSQPMVKVIDFGVAKAVNQRLSEHTLQTGFHQMIGTPLYMSPEQAEMSPLDVDTRADIYGLGVLLYELLTGTTPFEKERLSQASYDEIRRIIREEEPPRPSARLSTLQDKLTSVAAQRRTEPRQLLRTVKGELDWIVMKALEKDRDRRYETANGLAMDVQRYLADEPVLACPPSAVYRLKKFVRRNKGPVVAAAVVLLTLVGGIVGTTIGLVRAQQARQAEAERAEGERLAKERAEANFALANEAVEKYLGTVTDDPDLRKSDFHRLRKKLLESAIPFFQKIAEQKSDDPEVEAGRGRAYGRLSTVRYAMGENAAATRDCEAMRAIFARLAADFPTEPAYRRDLATSYSRLAVLLVGSGKHVEAEAAHRQALDIQEKLAADFPTVPAYRQALARSHFNLSRLLWDLGKHGAAEAAVGRTLDIQAKLAADFPTVPAYRQELAISHNLLGTLLADLGKRPEAEAAHRQALDIQEKLAADFPATPEYRRHLAITHNNLGILLAGQAKRPEAEAARRRALDLYEKLAADFPTVPVYRQELAISHNNLGALLWKLERHEAAEAAFRQALDIQEKLAADFPAMPDYRRQLAMSHGNRGVLMTVMGRRPEAEAAYRRALDLFEKLAGEFPTVLAHAVELGNVCSNYGTLILDGGQAQPALGWYQKAIARLEPIVAREPRQVAAREYLRKSHWGRARALDDLGRHAEATRDWERAAELDDGSMKAAFRMRMFRNRKDAAGCLAAAAENEARKLTSAGGLYDAACLRAICAAVIREDPRTPGADAPRLAQEQADLAMAWLHKAVAAGYKDVEHMKQDKDLDALREREDFKKLLAELQAEKK